MKVKENNVYPLMARYDRVIPLERQKACYEGHPVRILEKGHTTGTLAYRDLREHILANLTGSPDSGRKGKGEDEKEDARTMKIFYDEMTWPEVKEAAKADRVALVPVGSIEDHGKHLPVMTDNLIITSLCHEVGKTIPGDVVVLPTAPFGFEAHHMDFPGSIDVHWETLIKLWTDIGKSLAHHGFKRIVFANSHGSNASAVDLAAREVTINTPSICASFSWWSLVRQEASGVRESQVPGGVSHGGEMETSLVMYLRPDLVKPEYLVKEIPPHTDFIWRDLFKPAPVLFMDWWSRITQTGTLGDATLATAEKGEKVFKMTVARMCDFLKEFRLREIKERRNHQD